MTADATFPLTSYLARLEEDKHSAERAEESWRKEAAARAAELTRLRAYAWRRATFVEGLAAIARGAQSEEAAQMEAKGHLRALLGWSEASEARDQVLTRLEGVASALYRAARMEDPREAPADAAGDSAVVDARPDPAGELAAFEAWYAETRESEFWYLFEHYMPETPLVDF